MKRDVIETAIETVAKPGDMILFGFGEIDRECMHGLGTPEDMEKYENQDVDTIGGSGRHQLENEYEVCVI